MVEKFVHEFATGERKKGRPTRCRYAGSLVVVGHYTISYARSYLEDNPKRPATRASYELRAVLSHGLYDGRHDDAERVLEQLRANV